MMGSQDGEQEQLFYSFSLEDHVPKDHLLRRIDRFLDLSELRGQLAPFYSHTGRPSIDPVLMIRMLVIGYSFGIRIGGVHAHFHPASGRKRSRRDPLHSRCPDLSCALCAARTSAFDPKRTRKTPTLGPASAADDDHRIASRSA
jgi:hypothetical protein